MYVRECEVVGRDVNRFAGGRGKLKENGACSALGKCWSLELLGSTTCRNAYDGVGECMYI